MSSEELLLDRIKAYTASIDNDAADRLLWLPRKCLEISDSLKNQPWSGDEVIVSVQSSAHHSSKKRKTDDAGEILKNEKGDAVVYTTHVPLNPRVETMVKEIKALVKEFCHAINTLRMFIQLRVPKIEDGNNFGVSIQEETIQELTRTEDSVYGVNDEIYKYYVSRGKLCSKVVKYPNLDDYIASVKHLDSKMQVSLRLYMQDISDHCLCLYDKLQKNMERLKQPRGTENGISTMY